MVKKKVLMLGAVLLCTSLMLAANTPEQKTQDAVNGIHGMAKSAIQGKLQAAERRVLTQGEVKPVEVGATKDTRDCADATIDVVIQPDDYGSETTWQVVEQGTGTVVGSGGPYTDDDLTLIEVEVCVDSTSCYDFTIFDGYGDGICCSYGSGYYEVYYNSSLVGTGGDFGSSESVTFIGGGCVLPTGACCTLDLGEWFCDNLEEATCYALGGTNWYEGEDCLTFDCSADPLVCPVDSLFSQLPTAGDSATLVGYVSDTGASSGPRKLADNFSVTEDICDLHVWGVRNVSGWAQCDEDPITFEVVFYEDNAGLPGTPVCTYTQTVYATWAGEEWWGTDTLWRWDFDFTGDGCCTLRDGWVSVQGISDPQTCWFLWVSSPDGDSASAVYEDATGAWVANSSSGDLDLSMCLTPAGTGACCDDSTGICTPDVDEDTCLNTLNGSRFVPGVACEALNPPCGVLMGACCDYVTGACTMTAPGDCLAPNIYQGDYTNCDTAVCGGACCIDSTCIITTEGYCADQSGVWYGLGTDCDPSPCTGACCHADGTCTEETTPDECVGVDDLWLGGGTTCAECPCIVVCPAGATIESEACGEDLNGGCNSDPYAFESLSCGETICGTAWADGSSRDTDWFLVTVTTQTLFTFSAEAENFEMVIGIVSDINGVPTGDCAAAYSLAPYAVGGFCEPVSVTTECLAPGDYLFFVAPSSYYDVWPCDANYVATLTCDAPCVIPTGACCYSDGTCAEVIEEDCTGFFHGDDTLCAEVSCIGACCYSDGTCADLAEDDCAGDFKGIGTDCLTTSCPVLQPGDSCGVPLFVSIPADLPFSDLAQTTCGRLNTYTGTDSCLASYATGEDIFYEITVTTAGYYHATIDPKGTTWVGAALDDTCPPGASCILVHKNSSSGAAFETDCVYLEVGTYYLMISTWPTPDCIPDFDLTIDTCTPPLGRCCYDDAGTQMCADNFSGDCAALGGDWVEGLNCTDNPCPMPFAEDCATAIVVTSLPYAYGFDNDLATADGPVGTCDKYAPTTVMQNDAWFVWTATENCYATASATDVAYDVIMTVRADDCVTELYCADNADTGGDEIIVFSAVAGTTYYFQIGDTGSFETGGATTFSLTCDAVLFGACCFGDGTCTYVAEADCTGDSWTGGVDCDPNPCPQAGDNCGNPLPLTLGLADLPYTETNTNCGRGDDHDNPSTSTCLYYYDSGEEIIYELTLTEAMAITITLDPGTTTYPGMAIGYACPPTDDCIEGAYHSAAGLVILGEQPDCLDLAAGTYYIQVDTWASPNCIPTFDLTIEECVLPTGACCVEGACVATNYESECDLLDGDWFVYEDCATFEDCPQPCPDSTLRIEILTDTYSSETSWDLYSQYDGMIIATGDPDVNSTLFVWEVCVETNGCYDFTVYDSYGDGIYTPGYIEVYFDDVLVASNYAFTGTSWTAADLGGCQDICGDFTDATGTGPDGFTDQYDYWFFLDAFATCVGDLKYQEVCDLVDDDCIDWLDFMAWVQCYRDANPGSSWTPPAPRKVKKLQGAPSAPEGDNLPANPQNNGSIGFSR